MCLAVPGRIVAIATEDGTPVAEVDYDGPRRRAQLIYLPEARVGDYILVQAGFAVRRLSDAEAREALDLARGAITAAAAADASA
jgi:hydrogenase expression/formation protein HypC